MEITTYSPCKTMVSSTSTFLFKVPVWGAERARFLDATSGTGGVGFIFRTEDFLPAEANNKINPVITYTFRCITYMPKKLKKLLQGNSII